MHGHPKRSMGLPAPHPQLNTGTVHPQHCTTPVYNPPFPDRPHRHPGSCHSWSLLNATLKARAARCVTATAVGSWAAAQRSQGRCPRSTRHPPLATPQTHQPPALQKQHQGISASPLPSTPLAIQVLTSHLFVSKIFCICSSHKLCHPGK